MNCFLYEGISLLYIIIHKGCLFNNMIVALSNAEWDIMVLTAICTYNEYINHFWLLGMTIIMALDWPEIFLLLFHLSYVKKRGRNAFCWFHFLLSSEHGFPDGRSKYFTVFFFLTKESLRQDFTKVTCVYSMKDMP